MFFRTLITAVITSVSVTACALQSVAPSTSESISSHYRSNEAVSIPTDEQAPYFIGISQLRGNLTCTASPISFQASKDAPVYLLTNGHCALNAFSANSANEIIVSKTVNFQAKANRFINALNQPIQLQVHSVEYATMKGVDIGILRIQQNAEEIEALGLPIYRLAKKPARINSTIQAVGIPTRLNHLQVSTCKLGDTFDIVEGNWHWYQSVENDCQGISPGSSGSPVFNEQSEIIGILNTTNVDAVGETCYSSNPCAIDQQGANLHPNKAYMIGTHALHQCFDQSGEFNLSLEGCSLPKPSHIQISGYPYIYSGNNQRENLQQWGFSIKSDKLIRFKQIHLNSNSESCAKITGYSQPISASDWSVATARLPLTQEGVHQFCIITNADQAHKHPEVVQVIIDNTSPTKKPHLNINAFGDKIRFEPIFEVPEYTHFSVGHGPIEQLEACEQATLKPYRRIPFTANNVPTRICVQGTDAAGNQSKIFEYTHIPAE